MQHDQRLAACSGKQAYWSYPDAERIMRSVIRHTSGSGQMSVYRCRYCQNYHFGHDVHKTQSMRKTQ